MATSKIYVLSKGTITKQFYRTEILYANGWSLWCFCQTLYKAISISLYANEIIRLAYTGLYSQVPYYWQATFKSCIFCESLTCIRHYLIPPHTHPIKCCMWPLLGCAACRRPSSPPTAVFCHQYGVWLSLNSTWQMSSQTLFTSTN